MCPAALTDGGAVFLAQVIFKLFLSNFNTFPILAFLQIRNSYTLHPLLIQTRNFPLPKAVDL
jgi:hypothetical protein